MDGCSSPFLSREGQLRYVWKGIKWGVGWYVVCKIAWIVTILAFVVVFWFCEYVGYWWNGG